MNKKLVSPDDSFIKGVLTFLLEILFLNILLGFSSIDTFAVTFYVLESNRSYQ